jgi:hypothetical protein
MTQDRTYFRMLSNTALADAARHCDNDLALVLGERLHDLIDVEEELDAAQAEIEEITASREYWRIEAIDAQDALDALQAQLEAE